MARSGESRAQANKRLRQDALRESLAKRGLVQDVLEKVEKIQDLRQDLDAHELNRLRTACDKQLALINKYLPDVKAVHTTEGENMNLEDWLDEIEGNPDVEET